MKMYLLLAVLVTVLPAQDVDLQHRVNAEMAEADYLQSNAT